MTRQEPPRARILAEHAGLVFADKPAGIPTEPDQKHPRSVLGEVAALLALPPERLHAHSRLDLAVSGVVTLSVSGEARRRIVELRERGLWRRRYLALSAGRPATTDGSWTEPIGRGRGPLRSTQGARSQPAETHFAAIAQASFPATGAPVTLLALEPRTGRTHQLRVHAAAHGLPLLGDGSYGGPRRFPAADGALVSIDRIALHAARVSLGEGAGAFSVVAPLPEDLKSLWHALGGDPGAFEQALVSALP